MTEAGWLACADPGPMLESLRSAARHRRFEFFFARKWRKSQGGEASPHSKGRGAAAGGRPHATRLRAAASENTVSISR
jgi:hypothetical protein